MAKNKPPRPMYWPFQCKTSSLGCYFGLVVMETRNSIKKPTIQHHILPFCVPLQGDMHSSCFWCHAVHRHEWAFCEQSFINVPVGGLHTSGPNLIGRGKRCSNVACKDSPVALYLHLAAIMWCPFICSHDALRGGVNHFRDCEQRRSASAPAVVWNWIPPGLFFFSMLF